MAWEISRQGEYWGAPFTVWRFQFPDGEWGYIVTDDGPAGPAEPRGTTVFLAEGDAILAWRLMVEERLSN